MRTVKVTIEARPEGIQHRVAVLNIGKRWITLREARNYFGCDIRFYNRKTGREMGTGSDGFWIVGDDLEKLNTLAEKNGGTLRLG